ncbi:SDR family oxidoreductase [Paroceanicella profunda]|uniref:SDR family oxidoreductase n=1 Tax=Paroceanicella profunda TaxID=2579971 RepID=A0A5B8FWR0_9RHOB|nr:SDR family oxidoreductase [Paroceanicella profunda]QDL93326.1 SDR family oxidoreductase [Paroceanicella profunda]
MAGSIAGKVVLVFGGAGGIGSAAARDLAAKGAQIAIADIDEDGMVVVVDDIVRSNGVARPYPVDVTVKDDVASVAEDIVRDFGRIDVLINAAGVMFIRPLVEIHTVEWETTIDLNLKGTLWGIAAVLPYFLKQQSGHIINLGSVHGLKVFSPGGAVHSASKFAVRALSEGLRAELASTPIRVTTVTPGAVDTGIQNRTTGTDSARMQEIYKKAIPASAVSRAIAFAMEQPDAVDINEIVVRPSAQLI